MHYFNILLTTVTTIFPEHYASETIKIQYIYPPVNVSTVLI